mgnify:CR=1 FL=1
MGFGIIRYLRDHGVKHIFGVPDGHSMEMYDAMLQTDGIDHILVNDERTAGFAADAYARVTGSLGVCDAGPAGAMNFPVSIVEAMGSESPVLYLISAVRSYFELHNVAHDINIIDMVKPITKWARKLINPQNSAVYIRSAVKEAINGERGPVALVIPQDVLAEHEVRVHEYLHGKVGRGKTQTFSCPEIPCGPDLQDAIDLIKNAEQPVIFTGEGALNAEAYVEIKELSEFLHVPVFSTIDGKGIMKSQLYEDNNYFGIVGLFGLRPNHIFIKKKADLVIFVGNRLTEDDTAYFKYPSQERMKTIHVDETISNIGLNYDSIGVVGDPKNILSTFQAQLAKPTGEVLEKREKNIKWLRRKIKSYREMDDAQWMDAQPIKAPRVLKAIRDAMGARDYLITDASASSRWIGPYFPVKEVGHRIISPRGVGPTGFGVGALIGTHFALDIMNNGLTERPNLVLVTGDGGLMNGGLADLETIKKYGIDCTIVVLNNSALGYVKFGQALVYNWRIYDTERPTTDFSKYGELHGGKGYMVENLEDLDSLIQEVVPSKGFKVIDVRTDPVDLLPRNYY